MTPDLPSPSDVYLIRHGETANEFRDRCYGLLDVPLSPTGVDEVHELAELMRNCNFAAIYSSPRSRCVQTSEIIASHQSCAVTTIPELTELNFGEFEGKLYCEIERTHPELYAMWMRDPTEVQFPGGESFSQMCERVLSTLRSLRQQHAGNSIAIVSHAGVNRIILADALGMPAANIFRLAQRYAAINMIRYHGEYAVVELMNGQHWQRI
ncbi:MAG: alpha-ribazole phosphatase [Candidatus Acidiferrales bacterium]